MEQPDQGLYHLRVHTDLEKSWNLTFVLENSWNFVKVESVLKLSWTLAMVGP